MNLILANPGAINPARTLAGKISEITGNNYLATTRPERIRSYPFIRYGTSSYIPNRIQETEYNSGEFIRIIGNKNRFSYLMQENDIYCPIFYTTTVPEEFPVLVRSTMNGNSGEGITIVRSIDGFNTIFRPGYYWTPFIYTEFELRIHVAGNNILRVFKKIYSGDLEEELPIRNMARGYHFSLRSNADKYPKVQELVDRLNEIPLFQNKFYALDLGWDKVEKEYLTFEANSCPGMSENTAELYANYLIERLNL